MVRLVARSKGFISNAPSGPFQTTVFAFDKHSEIRATVLLPVSNIIWSGGQAFEFTEIFFEFFSKCFAAITSDGRMISHPDFLALLSMRLAVAVILIS